MEEKNISCIKPMNSFFCPYFQSNIIPNIIINSFSQIPFVFENIWEESEDDQHSQHKINYTENTDADSILNLIEKNNPMIIKRLIMTGVPYYEAKKLLKKL